MSYCSLSRRRRFTVSDFKLEHIVSFTAIFSNICTAYAQKRLSTSGVNLDTAASIRRPQFPIRVQTFGDLATFPLIFAFYMLNVRHISTSGLFNLLTEKVYRVEPHLV